MLHYLTQRVQHMYKILTDMLRRIRTASVCDSRICDNQLRKDCPTRLRVLDELSAILRLADAMSALRVIACKKWRIYRGGRGTWVIIPSCWIAWSDWAKRLGVRATTTMCLL